MRLLTRGANDTYVVELSPAEYEAALALWSSPASSEPLSDDAISAWEQVFVTEIDRLHLPTSARNALCRSVSPGNPFWGAKTGRGKNPALIVYGLPTWAEWCDRVLKDDLVAHLGYLRNFSHVSYGRLKQAIKTQRKETEPDVFNNPPIAAY